MVNLPRGSATTSFNPSSMVKYTFWNASATELVASNAPERSKSRDFGSCDPSNMIDCSYLDTIAAKSVALLHTQFVHDLLELHVTIVRARFSKWAN